MTEQRESVPSFCSFRANKLHGNDLLLIGIKEPSEVDRWLLTSCFAGKSLNDFLLVVVTQLYRDIIIQNELTGSLCKCYQQVYQMCVFMWYCLGREKCCKSVFSYINETQFAVCSTQSGDHV